MLSIVVYEASCSLEAEFLSLPLVAVDDDTMPPEVVLLPPLQPGKGNVESIVQKANESLLSILQGGA